MVSIPGRISPTERSGFPTSLGVNSLVWEEFRDRSFATWSIVGAVFPAAIMKLGRLSPRCQTFLHTGLVSLFVAPIAVLVATSAQAGTLSSWRWNVPQNQFEFTTDAGVQPKAQLLADPTRLVIDLPGVTLGRSPIQATYSGAIQSIRIGQFDRDTTRLVIELAPGYTLDPQQVKFHGISSQQWIVSLPQPQLVNAATAAGNTATTPERSRVQPPMPLLTPNPQPPSPSPLPPSIPHGRALVIIDPGHGGPDPGAVGVGGLQEKGIVLDIGRQVAGFLQQRGIQAMLTRGDDSDVDLEPRVQMAEQAQATVFVSIHANSIDLSRPDISGLETYYFQSGADLAATIHQTILQSVGLPDRGVRTARFYVLRKTSMPSVLVEVGFVTGRDDAMKLSNAAYRTQMADAIARGIVQYLQRTAKL